MNLVQAFTSLFAPAYREPTFEMKHPSNAIKVAQETIKTGFTQITPSTAEMMLSNSLPQRKKVDMKWVAALSEDIIEGRWRTTTQGITFVRDGEALRLWDGHHRLRAVLASQMPIDVMVNVVDSLDEQDMKSYDVGKQRTITETHGVPAWFKTVGVIIRGGGTPRATMQALWETEFGRKCAEMREFLVSECPRPILTEERMHAFKFRGPGKIPLLPSTATTVILFTYLHDTGAITHEQIKRFYENYEDNENFWKFYKQNIWCKRRLVSRLKLVAQQAKYFSSLDGFEEYLNDVRENYRKQQAIIKYNLAHKND